MSNRQSNIVFAAFGGTVVLLFFISLGVRIQKKQVPLYPNKIEVNKAPLVFEGTALSREEPFEVYIPPTRSLAIDVDDPTKDTVWTLPESINKQYIPRQGDWKITDEDLDTKLSNGHTVRDLFEGCFVPIRKSTRSTHQ